MGRNDFDADNIHFLGPETPTSKTLVGTIECSVLSNETSETKIEISRKLVNRIATTFSRSLNIGTTLAIVNCQGTTPEFKHM